MRVCIPWPLSRLLREEHGAHYDEEVSIQNGKVRLPTDVTVPRHTLVAEALDELAWVWGGGGHLSTHRCFQKHVIRDEKRLFHSYLVGCPTAQPQLMRSRLLRDS